MVRVPRRKTLQRKVPNLNNPVLTHQRPTTPAASEMKKRKLARLSLRKQTASDMRPPSSLLNKNKLMKNEGRRSEDYENKKKQQDRLLIDPSSQQSNGFLIREKT